MKVSCEALYGRKRGAISLPAHIFEKSCHEIRRSKASRGIAAGFDDSGNKYHRATDSRGEYIFRANLREISDHVTAFVVHFRHHVEQEWLDVVVQRLVVQEQLGQQTQILTVQLVLLAIHFEHRQATFPVYLVAGRLTPNALGLQVDEAELPDKTDRREGQRQLTA